MPKRLLLIFALTFMPLTAAADDTPAPDATDTPAASVTPAATPNSSANSLGPATTGTGTGSSAADSSALQPAGNNPLQSTTNDSTGLTAPNAQTLQGSPSPGDTLNVIRGEADGPTHTPDSGPSGWLWLGLAVILGAIVAAAIWFWRRRARPVASRPAKHQGTPAPTTPRVAIPEPTPSQRLRIVINRPAAEVFEFVLDPKNAPKWIHFIQSEETNEWPPQNGTIYKNQDNSGNWHEFKLSELKPGESFALNSVANPYNVRYTVTPESETTSELEYYEWMDEGNLAEPFTTAELKELKKVLETNPKPVKAAKAGEAEKDPIEDTSDETS